MLTRMPVAFREHGETAETWTRAPIAQVDSNGAISGVRFSNQLMQPLDPSNTEVEAFYDAYYMLSKPITEPANAGVFRGHAGDMQFLHGRRNLHARRCFDRSSGARYLHDTYFDFDDHSAPTALTAGDTR